MEVSVEPAEPLGAVAPLRGSGVSGIPSSVAQGPPSRIVTEDDDEMTFTDTWDDADEWPRQFGAAGLGIP